jgi:hypothetical protein
MVEELSRHFDTVDRRIDELTDADTQTRFKRRAGLAREKLTVASRQLSHQIKKLSATQQQLTACRVAEV